MHGIYDLGARHLLRELVDEAEAHAALSPVGEQQHLEPLLAEHLEVGAVLRGVEGLGGDEEDLLLLGLHARDVVGEHGVCGACTVLIDGVASRACLTLAVQVDGRRVDTVESLARDDNGDGGDGVLNDLQAAFKRHHALQCGFCTAGILMSCTDWLSRLRAQGRKPDEAEVRDMLSGHLCRCTGYAPIVAAVLEVAHA